MEKPEPSVIAHAKALRSVLTLSPLYTLEVPDELFITPSRVKVDLEQPYVPISSSTLRGKGNPRTTDPASLSAEEIEDMGAQGATAPHQLFALSVGMQLAKKSSVSECTGGGLW